MVWEGGGEADAVGNLSQTKGQGTKWFPAGGGGMLCTCRSICSQHNNYYTDKPYVQTLFTSFRSSSTLMCVSGTSHRA